MAAEVSLTELLHSYGDALDVLQDTLRSLHTIIQSQRTGERLSDAVLDDIEQQCTAAAVTASTLRDTLDRYLRG